MKERVSIYMQGAPEAYCTFISERNSNIARDIADFLGLPFKGETSSGKYSDYIVPSSAITTRTAKQLGIREVSDFYGGFVDHIEQVGKSILHPAKSRFTPGFYSNEFAEEISSLVLPGVTAFSKTEALEGFRELSRKSIDVRFKLPSESDGNGQSEIHGENELIKQLRELDDKCLGSHGLVFEQNLHNIKTTSVGRAQIGTEVFSFIAHQKEGRGKPGEKINGSFLGASLRAVRGTMYNLLDLDSLSQDDFLAISTAVKFDALYNKFMHPVASRMSYDYLTGTDSMGEKSGGITDITARLGGNCPALMVAIDRLRKNPADKSASAVVDLIYNPSRYEGVSPDAKIYLNHPQLRIIARPVSVL